MTDLQRGEIPPRSSLSTIERDQLIRSVVSSEALEGVELSYDLVNRLVDQVMLEPPIKLG